MMVDKNLIYLHGFRSSAQSVKARATRAFVQGFTPEVILHAPDLPDHPEEAMALISDLYAGCTGSVGFIGSSLGGFYACHAVETLGGRAALINPAVMPARDLRTYIGPQRKMYSDAVFEWTQGHLDALQAMSPAALRDPSRYYVLVETGDAVLDYREAVATYAGGKQAIIEGGDHSFQAYEAMLPAIFSFLFP